VSIPRTPPGFGPRGRRLWRDTCAAFELSHGELEVLGLTCRALDRVQNLEEALRDAPSTVTGSRSQPVAHPLASELRAEVLLASKLLAQLGLPQSDGDGSEWDGLSASARARKASRARWDNRGGIR